MLSMASRRRLYLKHVVCDSKVSARILAMRARSERRLDALAILG